MSDLVVRPARPDEFELLGEMRVRAYLEGGVIKPDLPYVNELRAVAEQAETAELLVAVDGHDNVLGTVVVAEPPSPAAEVARPGEIEFRMLATDPAARGRGVGETLVNAVIEQGRARSLKRVVLSVVEHNKRAIKLYERLGFRRLPERDWDPLPGVHLIGFGLDVGVGAVTVRVARPQEYPRVGELVYQAYDADGHVEADPDPEFGNELRNVSGEDGELLVAVGPDGELLGTITVVQAGSPLSEIAQPGEAELRHLATAPAARGRGVGKALVEAAIEAARAAGARRIVLSTLPTMTVAHRLYEARGFVRVPERDWEPAPNYPLLVFQLEL